MKKSLKGLNFSVIGMARSGVAAANLAKKLGANVFISESKSSKDCRTSISKLMRGIKFECSGHTNRILASDIVIKSPGVPDQLPIIKEIRRRGIRIISEIEFVYSLIKPSLIVGITGTNGKTTTTTLLGEIFKNACRNTVVAGNIGIVSADAFEHIDEKTNLILELSSYQLEDSYTFHPNISVILNITPDHLEHHKSMDHYIAAKAKIMDNQAKNDYAILNFEDLNTRRLAKKTDAKVIFISAKRVLKNGVYYNSGKIISSIRGMPLSMNAELMIPGMHNIENALCAAAAGLVAGISPRVIINSIRSFKGVEHRIEFVRELKGVKYINDSKATNVDSTLVALKSFNNPIILILGGRDKGSSYKPLIKEIKSKVRYILTIGEASSKISHELKGSTIIIKCQTLKKAVKKARDLAKPPDTVLLSPACASFDQFNDYEDRGRQFKNLVNSL